MRWGCGITSGITKRLLFVLLASCLLSGRGVSESGLALSFELLDEITVSVEATHLGEGIYAVTTMATHRGETVTARQIVTGGEAPRLVASGWPLRLVEIEQQQYADINGRW